MMSKKQAIFSPTKGFWNKDAGWIADPKRATDPLELADDAVYVDPDQYVQMKYIPKTIKLTKDNLVTQLVNNSAEGLIDLDVLLNISLPYQDDGKWIGENKAEHDEDEVITLVRDQIYSLPYQNVIELYNKVFEDKLCWNGNKNLYLKKVEL